MINPAEAGDRRARADEATPRRGTRSFQVRTLEHCQWFRVGEMSALPGRKPINRRSAGAPVPDIRHETFEYKLDDFCRHAIARSRR